MTTLDPLSEPFIRLFLRIDAAQPTDEKLRAAAALWERNRAGRVMPDASLAERLPADLASHVFLARTMINGTRHWLISNAGEFASSLLELSSTSPPEVTEKHIAVRLRRLLDLVAEKAEPYAAMFELTDHGHRREVVEIYAAPLAAPDKNVHMIFAAVNSRVEAVA